MAKEISFTAAGDAILYRHLQESYEGFEEVKKEIEKGDFRFFNLETTLHENKTFGGRHSGGGWLCAAPELLEDVKKFGFNITTAANNHSLDFMYVGLEKTLDNLKKYRIPSAGTGMDLNEAAAPVYLDFPKGRIALIAASSSFEEEARAGEAGRYYPGRPGLNALGHQVTYEVTKEQAASIQEVAAATGINAPLEMAREQGYAKYLPEGIFELGNLRFRIADKPAVRSCPDEKDVARIDRAIYEAKLQADYIVISIHAHEAQGADRFKPAEFLEIFARHCIDEGAHAVVGHGPHLIRPVEIYKNRPIFYSLGDFIFHNENLEKAPADFFEKYDLPSDATMHDLFKARSADFTKGLQAKASTFEAFVPHWKMKDGELTELNLYAVELGFGKPRSVNGWPTPAKDSHILEQLAALSNSYGTKFEIQGNRAKVILN